MAEVRVVRSVDGHRLVGDGAVVVAGNSFLEHLVVRRFSPATVRAYAFDVANFAGFLADRSLELADVEPSDLFDYLDWQQARRPTTGSVTALRRQGPSPATMNRRIAAVRGLFEHLVMRGDRDDNPVPVARSFLGSAWQARHARPRRCPPSWRRAAGAGAVSTAREHRSRRCRCVPCRSEHATAIGRSCWSWCSVACALPRFVRCVSLTWTWGCAVSGSSARETRNGSFRSMTCSSPSAPPISVRSAQRRARRRSASWCCGDRREARQ